MLNNTDAAIAGLINDVKGLAPEVWSAGLQQVKVQIVNNYIGIGIGLIVLILGIILIRIGINKLNKYNKDTTFTDDWDDDSYIGYYLIGSTIILFGIITMITHATALPQYLINPEWSAIQNIKSLV